MFGCCLRAATGYGENRMHELGVVFHVIKMVEEICEENNLTEIESVTLELGEVSTVIESYLHDVWKWAVAIRSLSYYNAGFCIL